MSSATPLPRWVAPRWHLALVVGLFLLLAALGTLFRGAPPMETGQRPSMIPLYLSLMAMEWGLLYFVWKSGLRRAGSTLRDLVGGRWSGPGAVVTDVMIGGGAWLVWSGLELARDRWMGTAGGSRIGGLLPQGLLESLVWIGLSLSAGFVEEVVFRGYLLRQFQALGAGRWAAVLLQALLFGVSHGYQGLGARAAIVVYGILLGALAAIRRSLLPGIVTHAWTDIFAGLLSPSMR